MRTTPKNQEVDAQAWEALDRALTVDVVPEALEAEQVEAIKTRLLLRVAQDREMQRPFVTVRSEQGKWRRLTFGIRVKPLLDTPFGSFLLKINAGSSIPPHRHTKDEECVVLSGTLQIGEATVDGGGYHIAPVGSRHSNIRAKTDAVIFLRGLSLGSPTELIRSLVSSLIPSAEHVLPTTIRSDEGSWREIQPGVQVKPLWQSRDMRSAFIRLAPGASLMTRHQESVVLEGEAFFGNTLMRTGEYQFAPAGAPERETLSDVGALLFVRSASDFI